MRGWIMAAALAAGCGADAAEPGKMELRRVDATSLDVLLERYFGQNGLELPPPVSDSVFLRRVYLDAWGIVPPPADRKSFLDDRRAGKRERLIDTLLANRTRYSEHWISFWNDLLRNDEGVNYIGERQSITAWLSKALEKNLPYHQMVAALLNPVAKEDPAGFLIGVNWRGDVSASQTPVMQAAQNSAQVFLGVNLKCNACHDSFISRWKLKDAYGLAGFFSEQPLELVRCDVKLGEFTPPKFLYPELGSVETGASLQEKRRAAARLFTMKENGRFARTIVNRYWKKLLGRGLVEPADDMDAKPWDADILDWLAWDFVNHGYDLDHLVRRILTSRAYALPTVTEADKQKSGYVFRGPAPRRLTAEQYIDSISAITGEWRILPSRQPGVARYVRNWRLKTDPLTRALGRAVRDQVITERSQEATTLQGLELTHGATLSAMLYRGAKRMLGTLEPAPPNIYDSGVMNSGKASLDIDISRAKKLWLLTEDADSYDRTRVIAGWGSVELLGRGGWEKAAGLPENGVTPVPSRRVLDIKGKGYKRLRGTVFIDAASRQSDINPRVRFFVFSAEPDPIELVRVSGETPFPSQRMRRDPKHVLASVWTWGLGREPDAREHAAALGILGRQVTAESLEDFLWALFQHPEFQFIW